MNHLWIKNADDIICKTGIDFFRYHPEFDGHCMDYFLMQPGAQLRVAFSFANGSDDNFWLKITRIDFQDFKEDQTKIEKLLDMRIDLNEFMSDPNHAELIKETTGSNFPRRIEFISLLIASIIPANFKHTTSTLHLFGREADNDNR